MVSAAISFVSSFLGYSMTAARVFKIQPVLNGIVTLASFVLSFLLIPLWGLEGAGYTLIAVSVIQLLGNAIINLYITRKAR